MLPAATRPLAAQSELGQNAFSGARDEVSLVITTKCPETPDFLQKNLYSTIECRATGWVHEESFDDFQKGLVRTWDNLKRKIKLTQTNLADGEKGQMLYLECSQHQSTLQGIETPEHFTAGSFHSLADVPLIGWHPSYEQTLKKFESDSDR